jgi:hypothetical protein
MDAEEGCGTEPAETVEAGEDFVEDDGEAAPGEIGGWRWRGMVARRGGVGGKEVRILADDLDETALEEGITWKSAGR